MISEVSDDNLKRKMLNKYRIGQIAFCTTLLRRYLFSLRAFMRSVDTNSKAERQAELS